MHAMIVAARLREHNIVDIPGEALVPPRPAPEAEELLSRILAGDREASRGGKLRLLDPVEQGFVLDQLIAKSQQSAVAESLMSIATSALLSADERWVIIERTTRRVTMFGNAFAKAALLNGVPPDLFQETPCEVRAAFFEDVIETIDDDRFDPVNELVPSLANHIEAVPEELHERFVMALLRHSRSSARRGAPAARRMLASLPREMAEAGINAINLQHLLWYGSDDGTRAFVEANHRLARRELQPMFADFCSMTSRRFAERYAPEDENDEE
jgi:hypothetical protein